MTSLSAPAVSTELARLTDLVGTRVGPTAWAEITQSEVDAFADLTGDHNFLHVDPDRARATAFGGPIAHGFLSLSLLAPVTQLLEVTDAAASVNYGMDKVRFPAPLHVGGHWRGHAEIAEVTEISGGMQARMTATLEIRDSERPAVVAQSLIRFYA